MSVNSTEVTVPSLISEEDWAGLDASLDLHIQLHNDPLPKGHITLEDSGEFVSRPQLSIFDWDSDGKLDVLLGFCLEYVQNVFLLFG